MKTRLHTVHAGQGDPALVFIHGMGTSAATWQACTAVLAHTHHTVAIDLLGHGQSPVPDDPAAYTRDAALADIDDVLAGLAHRTVLVGHSLGGYLALAHAATRPAVAAGIVVLNTGPGYRDADKREAWNERSRRNAHRFGVPPQAAELNLQHDSVVIDRLAAIEVPTLVLAGGDDRPEYASAGEYLCRKMPNAQMMVIEGGGHSMHEASHVGAVVAAVESLCERVSMYPRGIRGGGPGIVPE
jgi:pimeloyl-ACP methyl ester carboxylesterase